MLVDGREIPAGVCRPQNVSVGPTQIPEASALFCPHHVCAECLWGRHGDPLLWLSIHPEETFPSTRATWVSLVFNRETPNMVGFLLVSLWFPFETKRVPKKTRPNRSWLFSQTFVVFESWIKAFLRQHFVVQANSPTACQLSRRKSWRVQSRLEAHSSP